MPLGYAQGSIAGITLQDAGAIPCKVLIQDASAFRQTVAGSTQFAADGTIYTQILEVTTGRAFGVKVEYIPPDVLNDIIDAINAAIAGGDPFNVTLADDLTTINTDCIPDFAAGWIKIAEQRTHTDVVKDVVFRFIIAE
jgi:hypothetical protein